MSNWKYMMQGGGPPSSQPSYQSFASAPSVFDADSSRASRDVRSPKGFDEAAHPAAAPNYFDQLAAGLMGAANIVTELAITHPCVVLRRQCQVHQSARWLHLTPFTLVPVVTSIVSKEGLATLWKGAVGNAVVKGLSVVTELVIAEVFSLPRTVVPHGSSNKYMKHVALKMSTVVVMTPFTVAAFIETVRSGTQFEGLFSVLTAGMARLRFDFFAPKDSSKRFSIVYLAMPTLFYRAGHFFIAEASYDVIYNLARRYISNKAEHRRSQFDQYMPMLFARAASNSIADFLCYPIETVLHRLYIQGTRTLIDNLDTGLSAVSINVKYTGFLHCFRSIVKNESAWALYSGVGALVLQYGLHFCVLHVTRKVYEHVATLAQPHARATPSAPSQPLSHGSPSYSGASAYRSTMGAEYPVALPTTDVFDSYGKYID